MADDEDTNDILELTTAIVSAMVGNNTVKASELPDLIASTHSALVKAASPAAPEPAKAEPAVPIRSSVKTDYIVCLEDGAKLKMLKRYLRTRYNMSPEEYRAKWGLPRDYPMVAPAYAEQRRTLAQAIGLGRKAVEEVLSEPAAVLPKARAAAKNVSDGLANARKHLGGDAPEAKKRGRPAKPRVADSVEAEAPKRRGRPPKAQSEQHSQDAPADRDAEIVREPIEG